MFTSKEFAFKIHPNASEIRYPVRPRQSIAVFAVFVRCVARIPQRKRESHKTKKDANEEKAGNARPIYGYLQGFVADCIVCSS